MEEEEDIEDLCDKTLEICSHPLAENYTNKLIKTKVYQKNNSLTLPSRSSLFSPNPDESSLPFHRVFLKLMTRISSLIR